MSARIFADDALFLQRLLRTEGLYQADLDGLWGSATENAAAEFEGRSQSIKSECGVFDSRSESNISSLMLRAQREARLFLSKVLNAGINARIISGTRTYTEQDRLFRQGRFGNPGPVVTKARGGMSNHNFGIAWDIGIFTSTDGYLGESELYDEVAQVGLVSSLEWGGSWTGFVDRPHYQLRLNLTVAQLRTDFEAGELVTTFA